MSELAARHLVAAALELEPDAVGGSADVDNLPAWDSLGHVKVILALEQALGRPLTAPEVGQLRSIADVGRLLADRS